jgi:hypothetical protein
MARQESAREDLMREAVALVRRIELHVNGEPAPVVIGCRRDGAVSILRGDLAIPVDFESTYAEACYRKRLTGS